MHTQESDSSTNGTSPDETTSPDSPLLSGSQTTGGGTGEGLDRKIEKSFCTPRRITLAVVGVLMAGALAYGVW